MPLPSYDKNFRLRTTIRPTRYSVDLQIDPKEKTFEGHEMIDLHLEEATREVVLHGVDLRILKVSIRSGEREREPVEVEGISENDTIVFRFSEPIPEGRAVMLVAWTGRFCSGLRGLYSAGGLAVTQFEAAEARRVFPCFDEPGMKAPWAIALEIPKDLTALSNGPVADEIEVGALRRIRFQETPPLPTYLIAFVIGKLESTPPEQARATPVRTWATPGKVALTRFSQSTAVEVLARLEDYFGLPYGFGKLDQVAIPDFEAGAMENAGLVTYREILLLLDPDTAPLWQKKRVAEVITHELAHQWFGNWVTMAWWDDLWLNEAFATWMAYKIVHSWRPEWRVWLEFDAAKAAALQLDALRSTHPIRADVKSAAQVTESFDVITYEKGGAALRMIENYLGEAPFRDGIRIYMRRHANGNTTANDLWNALGEASREPVAELANSWISQAGYPLIHYKRTGPRIELSQGRFFSEPKRAEPRDSPVTWPVPMVLRYRDASGPKQHRFLLTDSTGRVELPAGGEVAWVCANASAAGFYRVDYDPAALRALSANLGELEPAERIALLSDEWALARADKREISAFLDLCRSFDAEEDHAVLDELGNRFASIEHRLVSDADRPRFQAFVSKLLGRQLEQLGWETKANEPDALRLRRAALVRVLGLTARSPLVIAEADARLERLLSGDSSALDPNIYDAVVSIGARAGDAARFAQFLERFRTETDPAFRRRFLVALAAFEAPDAAARAQELIFAGTVPLQDIAIYASALLANRATREGFWKKLREQWETFASNLSGAPMLLRRVIEAMGNLTERRHLEEIEALLANHRLEVAEQATAQTLERMRQDVEMRERAQKMISSWLDQN